MNNNSLKMNLIMALTIAIGGFILFNAAFLLAAGVFNLTMALLGIPASEPPPLLSQLIYLVIIYAIATLIFISKFNATIKATVFTMPLMVTLILMSIALNGQPDWLIGLIGLVILVIVLAFFIIKKMAWQYFFATGFVTLVALAIMIFNIEI